ncbi:MAG: hypothetical protein K2X32_08215, partial [Phycisphaerales bacterium]|nr:hypothetical protein [Phycisphaerales bacterium]
IQFFQFTVSPTAFPIVTACAAAPSTTAPQGASVTLSTTVSFPGAPGSVTADLSAFGLSSTEALTNNGGGNYSIVLNVPGAQPTGATPVVITATNPAPGLETATCSIPLTIVLPPPANDLCAGAFSAVIGTTAGNNASATNTGDPVPSCQATRGKGVWYTFTSSGPGLYRMDTEGSTQLDTVLTVYSACGGTQLACDDNTGVSPANASLLNVNLGAAQTVFIQVSSFGAAPAGGDFLLNIAPPPCASFTTQPIAATVCSGTTANFSTVATVFSGTPAFQWETAPVAAGPYTALTDGVVAGLGTVSGATTANLTITNTNLLATTTRFRVTVTGDCGSNSSSNVALTVLDCPSNDACANALPALVGTTAGNNANGTSTGDPVPTCQASRGKGIWYSFTSGAAGSYRIDTEGSAQSDTVVAVYDACGGAQIACDDDSGVTPANSSLLNVTLGATQTVFIQVASFGTAPVGGGFLLNIAAPPCASFTTQPVAVTACAGLTTSFSAVATVVTGTPAFQWETAPVAAGPYTALTDGVVAGLGTVSGATTANLSISNVDLAA